MITELSSEEIESKSKDIRQRFNPDNLSPFPFNNITSSEKNLLISYQQLDTRIYGGILFDSELNKFIIFINTDKNKLKQHFTLAHEFGHYFLHQDILTSKEVLDNHIIVDGENTLDGNKILFSLEESQKSLLEIQANKFASSLIMPEDLVKNAWKELKDIQLCAKVFNVSVSAMSIRLEKLNLV